MNNPAYSGSGIAPPTNAHAGSIRIHPLPVAALVASLLLVTGYPPAFAATRTVGPGGPPTYTYGTITEGFASITPGDIILVYPGTYPERVSASGPHGPALIKAVGTVIVDGRGAYTGGSWQQLDATNVYYSSYPTNDKPDQSQVFVGDLRYAYIPPPVTYSNLQPGQCAYDSITAQLYVNEGVRCLVGN